MLKVRGLRGSTLTIDPRDVDHIEMAGGMRKAKIVFKPIDDGEPMEFEAEEDISSLSQMLADALEGPDQEEPSA